MGNEMKTCLDITRRSVNFKLRGRRLEQNKFWPLEGQNTRQQCRVILTRKEVALMTLTLECHFAGRRKVTITVTIHSDGGVTVTIEPP
jgi:hypothetical protein